VVGETDLTLGQIYAGVDVGYSFGEFEPYAHAMYRNDFKSGVDTSSTRGGPGPGPGLAAATPTPDDDEIQYGVGLRHFGSNGLSARFEWATTVGRQFVSEDTYSAMARWDF
jgi:hypothetical protein